MVNRTNVFYDATTCFQTDRVLEKMWSRIILQAGENSVVDNAKLPSIEFTFHFGCFEWLKNNIYTYTNYIVNQTNY